MCLLVIHCPAGAQQSAPVPTAPPTKAEQELLALSKEKWGWMSEKKADTLEALFHEKAIFVHMGGD